MEIHESDSCPCCTGRADRFAEVRCRRCGHDCANGTFGDVIRSQVVRDHLKGFFAHGIEPDISDLRCVTGRADEEEGSNG